MYYVTIENVLIDNIEKDSDYLLVYALIKRNLTYRHEIIFSIEWLLKQLGLSNETRNIEKIKNVIKFLVDMEIIDCDYDNITAETLIIAKLNENLKNLNYFKIIDDEIEKILSTNMNKFKLFALYCIVKRSINTDTKVTYISQEKIAKMTSLSNKSIVKYKQELVRLGLINVANAGAIIDAKGKIKNSSDYISCTCDDAEGEILRKDEKTKGNAKNDVVEAVDTEKRQKKEIPHMDGDMVKSYSHKENSSTKSENCQIDFNENIEYAPNIDEANIIELKSFIERIDVNKANEFYTEYFNNINDEKKQRYVKQKMYNYIKENVQDIAKRLFKQDILFNLIEKIEGNFKNGYIQQEKYNFEYDDLPF